MKRSLFETILGAVVLLVAGVFFFFAVSVADIQATDGYQVTAEFSKIGGLSTGNDVRISGVKIGTVKSVSLNPDNYKAMATLSIKNSVQLPIDTVAQVLTEGLLGGFYLSVTPGIEEEYIENEGSIDFTQPPVDLMDLLGRFIFSSANEKKS